MYDFFRGTIPKCSSSLFCFSFQLLYTAQLSATLGTTKKKRRVYRWSYILFSTLVDQPVTPFLALALSILLLYKLPANRADFLCVGKNRSSKKQKKMQSGKKNTISSLREKALRAHELPAPQTFVYPARLFFIFHFIFFCRKLNSAKTKANSM